MAQPFVCRMGRPPVLRRPERAGLSGRPSSAPRRLLGTSVPTCSPLCFRLRSLRMTLGRLLLTWLLAAPWCFMRLRSPCGSRGVV